MGLGLADGELKFVEYDPKWPDLFAQEKQKLEAALGDRVLDIQHIGSTAIPGIIAKPILDLSIAVANFEIAQNCIEPITSLGYQYLGEYGIPRRHYFIKNQPRTHQIHIFESSSWDWQRHLLLRDYFRKYSQKAQEYADLKRQLYQEYEGDRAAYQ
ncbi:MAG: GrpB family protein, partial [Jaaginema sp. PMC 1079.18]|nr:GrpB family protein [Jaaginema sp. PMC 1079.18]